MGESMGPMGPFRQRLLDEMAAGPVVDCHSHTMLRREYEARGERSPVYHRLLLRARPERPRRSPGRRAVRRRRGRRGALAPAAGGSGPGAQRLLLAPQRGHLPGAVRPGGGRRDGRELGRAERADQGAHRPTGVVRPRHPGALQPAHPGAQCPLGGGLGAGVLHRRAAHGAGPAPARARDAGPPGREPGAGAGRPARAAPGPGRLRRRLRRPGGGGDQAGPRLLPLPAPRAGARVRRRGALRSGRGRARRWPRQR